MCGIIGIGAIRSIEERSWLIKGRDAMLHRGPDDSGLWWSSDGRVGFGHRRLSVVDLSTLGHQPMLDDANELVIVFNGEIYNHDSLREELSRLGYFFRSHSDTEVLLAAYKVWGESFLTHLNGMFALAIYDIGRQTLFLARDRVGEKPLFYLLSDGQLQFASELKGLLANASNPRCIELSALDHLLACGFVPSDGCILKGYNKLPPAHFLKFDLVSGKSQLRCYWQLPAPPSRVGSEILDDVTLLNEFEELLEDAVGRQLVADVPVGILLSGGVDSSLITAMAVRRSNKVRTFSVGFPGHRKLDETPHARLIAQHFATEHTELMVEDVTADLLPRLAQQFDEPIVDSSMIPTFIVGELVRQHCTVALGGDGGDELFGGYSEYSRLLWMQNHLSWMPVALRKMVSFSAKHFISSGFARSNLRAWLIAVEKNLDHDLPLLTQYFDPYIRLKLLKGHMEFQAEAEINRAKSIPAELDLLQRMTRMDFKNYLSEDILVKVDRSSMLNSLEMRAPFLDFRLIEFAFGRVPSRLKATSTERKILLKQLCRRVLPKEFDMRRKQGFSVPLDSWLRSGPFYDLFWDTLTASDCLFSRDAIQALFDGQKSGQRNGERLFALVEFELWRRQYGITL
jgi:asparagine synthase (glutamine-hydrolysing)